MTRAELGNWIRTPPTTLAQWATKGTGPRYYLVGRRTLYRRSDVEAWLQQQERVESHA
jgi:hypothetical protein